MPPNHTERLRPRLGGALAVALVFAGAAAFWTLDLAALRAGVPAPLDDTWEYGVAARHLLAGQGFRTSVIHPPLWALRDSALTVPILIHGPVLPLLLAPLLRAAGPGALDHVAWIAALFAAGTACLVFRAGRRHFGAAAAAAAAALFTLSPITIAAVHHDPSPALGALLLALALDLLARERPLALSGGLAVGVAYLARAEMLPAIPLLGVLAGRAGWLRYAAGILVCAAPWWWHNLHAAGSPLFNLSAYLLVGYWGPYPDLTVLRDFHLTPERWPQVLMESLPSLPRKWLAFFPHAAKGALFAPSAATGWLVPIGAAAALRSVRTRRVATVALLVGLAALAVLTTTFYVPRYMFTFLPLWCLAAAAGTIELTKSLPARAGRSWIWIPILGLLMLPSTIGALARASHEARAMEQRLAQERAVMRAVTGSGGAARPMFSDTPDFAAWTVGRPVLWVTRDEYERLPAEAALGGALPARGESRDTWFHAAAPESAADSLPASRRPAAH